jgi:hypothetical protein
MRRAECEIRRAEIVRSGRNHKRSPNGLLLPPTASNRHCRECRCGEARDHQQSDRDAANRWRPDPSPARDENGHNWRAGQPTVWRMRWGSAFNQATISRRGP